MALTAGLFGARLLGTRVRGNDEPGAVVTGQAVGRRSLGLSPSDAGVSCRSRSPRAGWVMLSTTAVPARMRERALLRCSIAGHAEAGPGPALIRSRV